MAILKPKQKRPNNSAIGTLEYDARDKAALQLAVDITLAETDKARVAQVERMLADREWIEVAKFCSYHRQGEALRLLPWQMTPMGIYDPDAVLAKPKNDGDGLHEAALLLKKMLAAGVSRYHPDPVAAIKQARK